MSQVPGTQVSVGAQRATASAFALVLSILTFAHGLWLTRVQQSLHLSWDQPCTSALALVVRLPEYLSPTLGIWTTRVPQPLHWFVGLPGYLSPCACFWVYPSTLTFVPLDYPSTAADALDLRITRGSSATSVSVPSSLAHPSTNSVHIGLSAVHHGSV